MLETGMKHSVTITVREEDSASVYGSGTLMVFATPAMIALMERTSLETVAREIGEGNGTVGTLVNVKHLAPTPMGMKVTCTSELIEIDRKRLVFRVEAHDECGLIGEGIHERFIINEEKFQAKADSKGEERADAR